MIAWVQDPQSGIWQHNFELDQLLFIGFEHYMATGLFGACHELESASVEVASEIVERLSYSDAIEPAVLVFRHQRRSLSPRRSIPLSSD